MEEIGIYIHIPFCKQKCIYCDFTSFANQEKMQERYINALKKEIINWKLEKCEEANNIDDKENMSKIDTIYIGGGTPSYIESRYIKEIIDLLKDKIVKDCEITIEVNPGTVTEEKLKEYKEAGINRISIGLQSTQNTLLKQIGRIHTYEEFLQTYKMARKQGFKNINVDLMIGVPNQTIKDLNESLQKVISLEPQPEHISVYSLIVEENTVMEQKIKKGELKLPDEELERHEYWYMKDFLELRGYKHYEISNFAKQGYESKHNLNCWEQKEYRGFGLAAHSYINKSRFCNISSLENYIQNIENNNFKKNIIIQEKQSTEDEMKEYMLLGLRKINGVSIQDFKNKFGENPIMLFRKELQKLTQDKLITIDGDFIKLSNKGLDLANLVWEEFV